MKKEFLFLGFAVIFLLVYIMPMASAQAVSHKILADSNFRSAQDYYNSGDCITAIEAANRALNYYGMDGDTEGMLKTTDLIGDIKECLKKAGDAFYQQASAAYDARDWDGAISWAESAKKQYDAMPDNISSQRCVSLIARAQQQIENDVEALANRTYKEALNCFDIEDLVCAKSKANEALDLFNSVGNQQYITLTQALISAIDKMTREFIDLADQKIGLGTDLYTQAEGKDFQKLLEAKKYAEEAKGLYTKAGDTEGFNTATELINACSKAIGNAEASVNAFAEQKVVEGRNEYLLGQGAETQGEELAHYIAANRTYFEARNAFSGLFNWAKELHDSKKTKTYQDKIADVDNRINIVKTAIENINKGGQARELYNNATLLFTKGLCRNASIMAHSSMARFSSINDQTGVTDCKILLIQIDACIEKIVSAESHLRNAAGYMRVADYLNASNETDKALALYTEVKNEEGIKNATGYKSNISAGQEKKDQAGKLLAKAEMDFDKKAYEESKAGAESAWRIYKEINYSQGIIASEALRDKAQIEIQKVFDKSRENIMLLGGGLVLGLIIIVITGYSKRVKRQKKKDEEIAAMELAKKQEAEKKDQAEKAAEDQRLREMDEERQKLKAMIADEMKKVEEEKKSSGQI